MILIILFFLFSSLVLPAHAASIYYGAEAPQFTLSSTDGEKVSLSEYKGDIVVIFKP